MSDFRNVQRYVATGAGTVNHSKGELVAYESFERACDEIDRLRKVEEAAKRIVAGKYLDWTNAAGPNECEHGYAEGIPCMRCDREIVMKGDRA